MTNRGPDFSRVVYKHGILFHAAVLWQQGSEACVQPVESDDIVLLFNGDLYLNCLNGVDGSDTEFLFELISKARTEEELLNIFSTITGPFSIICFFKTKLYFARDSLGRNSMILGKHREAIFLTSVADPSGDSIEAIELPPLGVFSIDMSTKKAKLFPYQDLNAHPHNLSQLELLNTIVPVEVCKEINPEWMVMKADVQEFTFDDAFQDLKDDDLFEQLLNHPAINRTCETFLELLTNSVQDRIKRTPEMCKSCIKSRDRQCSHARIGILFSGGVDCTMISLIAEKFIDPQLPIDFMNVAFERVSYTNKKIENVNWNVPDRMTGLETLNELRKLRPERKWNFIETNITRAELGEHSKKLSSLVFPLSNVLDESLGAALYFASRGHGIVDGDFYASPCRVILIGSGADELFGGYTRHRNAFKRSTPEHDLLLEELNLDWIRLPSRNLARDDRVIADSGITVRAPFIEENFVNFVQKLKPLQRCYPALPEGVGDKLLLRLCAYKLGLKDCSRFRKRALQFGSRIADKRQSARDKSTLLTHVA